MELEAISEALCFSLIRMFRACSRARFVLLGEHKLGAMG